MANTILQLKKSGVTGNVPPSLAYGEMALNYADGKLYYKHANGSIASISTGSSTDSFATINANSSLILATSPTDTLSFNSANGITISTDTVSKIITIGASVSDSVFLKNSNILASSNAVNSVFGYAQAAYAFANSLSGGTATDGIARDLANNAYALATSAYSAANNASSNTIIIQGVDVTQNTRLNSLETVNNNQNTSISIIQGVDNTQNTRLNSVETINSTQNTNITAADSKAQAAFDKANTAITTSGGTINGNLTVTGNVTAGNIVGTSANTTIVAGAYTTTFDNFGRLTLPGNVVFSDATTQTTAFIGNGVDSFARTTANGANGLAAGAYNTANTNAINISIIQGVDTWQNTQITQVNQFAQSSYDKANTAITTSGGTITGNLSISQNLTVTGDLTVLGNNTIINTSQLDLEDSLIYLANNNYTSDAVDIGFIGHYNNGANAHTGLIRDPNLKEWIFFQGYTPEVQSNNVIDINDPSFQRANVIAEYFKGNLVGNSVVVDGINVRLVQDTQNTNITYVNQYAVSAYQQANVTIGVDATQNTRLNSIETINTNQNTSISIIQGVDTWQNNQIIAVNQFAQAAFDQANTGGGGGGGTSFNQSLNTTDPVIFQSVTANVYMQNGGEIYGSNTIFSDTTANQTMDMFSSTEFRTAKYLIQAISGNDVHSTEILLTHNDVDVLVTEYARTYTTPLMTVSSTLLTGNVIVIVTPLFNDTTIDFTRTSLIARQLGSLSGDLMLQSGTEDLNTGSGTTDLNI